jgi:hypothetical protein
MLNRVHRPLKVIAFHANGILRQHYELGKQLQDLHIDVALFSETHLKPHERFSIQNYHFYRRPDLSSERAPQKWQDSNFQQKKISGQMSQIWAWHQDILTDWPSVAMWLWLWLLRWSRLCIVWRWTASVNCEALDYKWHHCEFIINEMTVVHVVLY